jgi:hypothetical protein
VGQAYDENIAFANVRVEHTVYRLESIARNVEVVQRTRVIDLSPILRKNY